MFKTWESRGRFRDGEIQLVILTSVSRLGQTNLNADIHNYEFIITVFQMLGNLAAAEKMLELRAAQNF